MRLGIQKINFEKTQKMHNEMVEIFHQRMNDNTITEDDYGTKNISSNRIQSSLQEISQIYLQEPNSSAKIIYVAGSKKRFKYQSENSLQDNIKNEGAIQTSQAQNHDTEHQKQEQSSQLQDSIIVFIKEDQKSFLDQHYSVDLENQSKNLGQQQDQENIHDQFNPLNNPSFRKNDKCSESESKSQDKSNLDGNNKQSSSSSSRDSKTNSQSEGGKQIELNGQLEKWKDNIIMNDFSKQSFQNQSQTSGRNNELSAKKQKQSMTSQFGYRKSRKFTVNDKQISQKKNKNSNFLHIIMKMKNYAYKMASSIESKRLAILQRQKFFYFRDKTINYEKQEKEQYEFYDYNLFQRIIRLIFVQALSNSITKRLLKSIPSIPLFQPQSLWKFVWDIFNMIIVILFFFYLPLYFIYGIHFSTIFYLKNVDIILVTITTLDIFINLNTLSYRKGNLLQSRSLILLEYFTKNGLLNLSFVAVLWIIVTSQRSQLPLISNYKFSILFFIVALFKVFRQNSFKNRIYDRFYLRKVNRGFISLMQIFFNLFIVSHLFACIWLVVGKINQTDQSILCATQQNINDISYSQCTYSWLDKLKGVHNLTFYEEYLRAYYFSTVTMITVGYGDITPVNSNEYLLSILTMLIACGMFGYSLNSIGQILSEMQINNKEYDEHFNAIYGFMHKKNISTDLQVQVREYLQYFFIQSNQEDIQKQQKVIQLLPDTLQSQILLEANKIVFENSPLFKYFKSYFIHKGEVLKDQKNFFKFESLFFKIYFFTLFSELIIQINPTNFFILQYLDVQIYQLKKRTNFSEQIIQKTIKIIEQREFVPGQKIVMQDVENDNSIFFIEKGSVEIYNSSNNEELKLLHKGEQFGEIQFFTGQTSQVSVRSVEFTKLLAIKRNSFLEIIQSSPLDLEKFCMIKDSIIFSNKFDIVGIFCYCCKSSNHLITQCNFIHLQQDKYKIIKEYVKNNIQVRDKDTQRRTRSYDTLQLRDQIEENAKLFVEENIDDLCTYGWFNDIIQQEFQGSLGYPSHASLRTIGYQQQIQQDPQKVKAIQNFQNQFANKKIQYQKIKNMMDIQSSNSYSELNPNYEKSISVQYQQKSYSNFQNSNLFNNEEYSSSPQAAININKKVQFSINSLQDNIYEEADCKSLKNQCQFSQFVKQQSHPNNNYHYQINGADYNSLNTPTNRQRQLSNLSEVCPSPYSAGNNLQVNLNSANYYFPYQSNTPSNNYSTNSQYFQYTQSSNYNIPEVINQHPSQESSNSNMLSNLDTYSLHQKGNSNDDNNIFNKLMNQSKQLSINDQKQKQQEFIHLRNNVKKNTLKKHAHHQQMTKQLSSAFQKQTNEALIKQLKELVSLPLNLTQIQDFQFDTLKNYSIYMPHNNCERVLLLYQVNMRKNQPILNIYKTKKSLNKNDETQLQNLNKKQQTKTAINNPRMSIQQYKDVLKKNEQENN